MKPLLLGCLLLLASSAFASTPTTVLPAPKTDKLSLGPWEDEIGYRQAVRVGNTLYVSGCVGAGPMADGLKHAYGTLQKTLAHYGLGFQHVVKENVYTTQIDELKANGAVRREFYGRDFPAATWVQVARLFQPDHVIEVEVVAVFPDAKP